MRTTRILAGLAATSCLLLIAPTGASASPGPGPRPAPVPVVKSDRLAAPFNLAFGNHRVYVADGGLNLVGTLQRDRTIRPIAEDQPGASGIAVNRDRLAYTTTVSNPETFENTASALHIWGPRGKRVVADTLAYETKRNPDKINHYGVRNPSTCVRDAFGAIDFPVDYTGQVDSHAYSVASWRGNWVVADAGANALWLIDDRGRIQTLAVLPPQPTAITAEAAAEFGLPDCVVGVRYAFEPVPTDVEVGRDGYLYVTTLPGGPESAALGARGSVYRVNPWTGRAQLVAGGFLGATNLALGDHGRIYVAELFGGKISVLTRWGGSRTYASLPGVVAVETDQRGSLWAATLGSEGDDENPPVPGTIVKFEGGHRQTMGRRVD